MYDNYITIDNTRHSTKVYPTHPYVPTQFAVKAKLGVVTLSYVRLGDVGGSKHHSSTHCILCPRRQLLRAMAGRYRTGAPSLVNCRSRALLTR